MLSVLQERTECSKELPAELLSKVIVGPRQLDFGKISPALPATQHFVVKNTLNNAVHVVLDTSSLEELSCTSPASQVIPAGATAKFQLSLRCHDVQLLKEKIQYCINGCHIQSVDVVAEVVAVTLELSNEELMFSFSLDNWDNYVEKVEYDGSNLLLIVQCCVRQMALTGHVSHSVKLIVCIRRSHEALSEASD